jgi:hypothetical protein
MVADQALNNTVVIANSRRFLPVTSGTVGSLPKRTYQLCFKDSSPNPDRS